MLLGVRGFHWMTDDDAEQCIGEKCEDGEQ